MNGSLGKPMATCPSDGEPLMFTFEFPKKEFYCVVCKRAFEFFGPKAVQWTQELQTRHDELKVKYDAEREARKVEAKHGA